MISVVCYHLHRCREDPGTDRGLFSSDLFNESTLARARNPHDGDGDLFLWHLLLIGTVRIFRPEALIIR